MTLGERRHNDATSRAAALAVPGRKHLLWGDLGYRTDARCAIPSRQTRVTGKGCRGERVTS